MPKNYKNAKSMLKFLEIKLVKRYRFNDWLFYQLEYLDIIMLENKTNEARLLKLKEYQKKYELY